MPFVQRIVQPIYLAQTRYAETNDTTSGSSVTKFYCMSGKCNNNNCINQAQQQQQHTPKAEQPSPTKEREAKEDGCNDVTWTTTRDKNNDKKQLRNQQLPKTITTAVVHQQIDVKAIDNGSEDKPDTVLAHLHLNINTQASSHSHKHTNGFASSFSYATDTEEEPFLSKASAEVSVGDETSALLSMKKLKHHVEFLSATSPSSQPAKSGLNTAGSTHSSSDSSKSALFSLHQLQQKQLDSPTTAKIITGYEFDSISNITLSNALRQLASLVMLASDIFEELQQELQNVGDRSRAVQRKITMVERKVCAFDPKTVTVPESDLLTFAQRKTHYQSDKLALNELFTAETRPHSVKVLYEDAGKSSPQSTRAATSPRLTSFAHDTYDGPVDFSYTGASQAAGSNELVCTPVFGKANRKMRTRIDAEIEIRLPAAIEDLRKWTSSEALGDVTVTPDCMHHVDTSISTSVIIGDNGILTPALSPSVLSADAVDALYSINTSNTHDNTQIPNDINKDVPLNHRLPSPEEQCKIIALRYPAEVISVDTSGKRFERMCLARKSTTGCVINIADTNNLNEDVQTVSRRSRSRKVRGKRRNTIAGIDQKEIQDAANGDSTATSSEIKNNLAETDANAVEAETLLKPGVEKSKKFGRSKSSDILKKESVALPYDKGKSTLTRLNSLKQWGRNRFKFMQRTEANTTVNCDTSNNFQSSSSESRDETHISNGQKLSKGTSSDGDHIDDECVVHDLITKKSEGRFSHERKPSYSSSEKSMSVSSSGHLKGKLNLATSGNNVRLRDTSSLNRQRRNGISANCFAGKDEQPHSSSGNWSASSESGRASIGSEITIQPKSSASNTSLNVSSFHPGSGPPSSMLSRRRFFNTSASSSVTSDGTATPDLQVPGDGYSNHLDDETSSAYSCDTEGYYTSFHIDSGLRTLKEEEPPLLPLQHAQTSSFSFGSQSNQTVLNAENEYELYGRGSTSTTTSSAGTVCTTLMANEQNSLNAVLGPDVPERSSSLLSSCGAGNGKLNRNCHSNSASTSTLERSYSSSTIGSTLERTGTIKRNVNSSPLKITPAEVISDKNDEENEQLHVTETPESQEDEFDFEQNMCKLTAQPLPGSSVVADLEYSESSDLEGVERIERIKQKTAINAKRIPSMCIITPSTSDDENHARDAETYDPNRTLTNESSTSTKASSKAQTQLHSTNLNEVEGYCMVGLSEISTPTEEVMLTPQSKDHNLNLLTKRGSHYGLNNVLEKLKVVLPNIKRSPNKNFAQSSTNIIDDDELYDTAGEYVTIADISNNNRQNRFLQPKSASGLGIYYSNDIVRRHHIVASRDESGSQDKKPNTTSDKESSKLEPLPEYISLNELPYHLRKIATYSDVDNKEIINVAAPTLTHLPNGLRECADSDSSQSIPMYAEITEQRERPLISPVAQNKGGQRVKLNAQGRAIYDSDSLKRRKGAHTTFAPGPYVKETESALAESPTGVIGTELSALHKISESGQNTRTNNAKLIFLNGSSSGLTGPTRKVANVKPLITNTKQLETMSSPITSTIIGPNVRNQHSPVVYGGGRDDAYLENKNLLANNTNPFFQVAGMMSSPSNKSTSSTGSSTISTNNSTHTQASTTSLSSTSSHSKSSSSTISAQYEEGYQLLYKSNDLQTAANNAMPFQRNGPVYWTLQNRKQQQKVPSTIATCRDDLYATPLRRSERTARTTVIAASNTTASISPIVPRNRSNSVGFLTSTPTKLDSQLPINNCVPKQKTLRPMNWNDDSPERLNTCADRIGTSKTSLMDFKKLLLAKSAKTSPVQKKVSAVELLKKTSVGATLASNCSNRNAIEINDSLTPPLQGVNAMSSSLKLLDLSSSPKTFASRRMLRHGQFGSPSKSFAPKSRSSPGGWRNNVVQRTDIMSTTILEVNSEEDQSSANSSSSKSLSTTETVADVEERLQQITAEKFNLKRNYFLQTEENNFMRGELKKSFTKANDLSPPLLERTTTITSNLKSNRKERDTLGASIGHSMPALETAL